MQLSFLSFDLGASSGRAVVTRQNSSGAETEEIFRFENHPIQEGTRLVWDFPFLCHNIDLGLEKAFLKYPDIRSIGIDTWGVDYGMVDSKGILFRNPTCYRDSHMNDYALKTLEQISKTDLYKKTGIQYLSFNTLFQLSAEFREKPQCSENTFLLMPDLIAFYLTGMKRMELTNLSTTNFYNPNEKKLLDDLESLGISRSIFPEVIYPGETYGFIRSDLAARLSIPKVPVVAVCTHDTASAVLAIKMTRATAFISSGTWSLCGTVLSKPITSIAACQNNFTNEVGFDHSIRFLKNVMGLWILNQCRSTWEEQGMSLSFHEMELLAMNCRPFVSFIDPDDDVFLSPGNMPSRIQEYCKKTKQTIPANPGEIVRCVYQSLALKYRMTIQNLETVTGHSFRKIIIVGGGTQIDLLNQMTASSTNKKVEIGMKEATIAGNTLVQMLHSGYIQTVEEGRALLCKGQKPKVFDPLQVDEYNQAYSRFIKIIGGTNCGK